ncbi:hypothetical protein SAMN05216178_6954 [Pseudomonas saponiphila]|jgi:hypothetical protein|uniref:Uncharacterized protein n=1 Tax=Pseudomonas saponiphila TaxID=556534 RepID=A0A1H5A3P9_9PSED|nr:hypothetical protein [Pseudomonas saponiphila]SED36538.1 hypothetical protein SAMN05216178_6954 [Pseudomonas saponiphila]
MDTAEMEAARLIQAGVRQVSAKEMRSEIEALGYRIDLRNRADSVARYVDGPFTGVSYPARHFDSPREADTGLSFCHFQARRDECFQKLQALRDEIFCIVKDRKGVARIGTF